MTTTEADLFFVRAITPIHVGVDQGVGAIKLPTMRDATTGHPLIPGSSLRGVLRDAASARFEQGDRAVRAAFGPPRENASDHRGGLVISDARLLFLAVQSLKGTFAWATSQTVLRRLAVDAVDAGAEALVDIANEPPEPLATEEALIAPKSALAFGNGAGVVSLREVLVTARHSPRVERIAQTLGRRLWQSETDRAFFTERVVVLHETLFDALTRLALDVRARVPIDSEKGTAQASGPWTEEHIPAESVLAGLAFGRPTRYRPPPTQGDASVSGETFAASQVIEVFRAMVPDGGHSYRLGGHSGIGLGRAMLHRWHGAKP